jgi:putative membrane-bound dehydrogenase-like protein
VAEMGDYPTGPPDGGRPRSRIKRLEDRDGDGRYEHARVFADGLSFCTGLQPWRGGLIVTRAGGIDFLKDADGDGRADGPGERETWFTGFAEQNSQLRANHPVLGVDGLVSVANGLRGGTIVPADHRWQAPPDAGIDIRGRDFRFDPRGGLCESITGPGQFGLTFDDAGTRFICSNRNPCIQVMFEDRDLRRQPALALAAAVQDASPAGERSRVHPLSRAWTTSNLHANQFSAACGVHIHRGDGLPAGYVGNAFVCEPTGNLVHRDRLELHGVTWQAVANDSGREFLASVDDWFRPVALADGPDGCLYVADMHRAVIEHPEFMPPEIANRPDLRDGDDRGRIYRIRDAGRRSDRHRPQLSQATSGELVGLLDHPNGWHRDTAARLLLERADPEAVPALQELATHGRTAAGRIRSLWLLARLGGLESPTLQAATRDADPSVRAAALTLAGPLLATDEQLVHRLLEAATETDARVRFAVALRIGDMPQAAGADATAALANLLRAAPDDRWLRAAVLSSSRGRAAALLAQLLDAPANTATALTAESAAEIAAVVGAAADEPADAVAATIEAASGVDGVAVAVLDGLCKGLDRRRVSLADLTASWPEPARTAVTTVLSSAARITADDTVAPEARLLAIRLLRQASASVAVPALLPLAAAASDQAVRSAAIATLARFDDPRIDDAMLADIQRQTSTVRRATIDASVSRPARAARLLDALDRGDLAAACLAPDHWNRLAQSPQAEIRGRAEKLRTANAPEDRVRVIEAYAAAAQQPGDAVRGRAVFARVCAACHRVDGLGVNVGPDISDSRTKRPEQYLVDILDPNRAIDAGSFACTVQLADGRSLTGLIVAETGGSLTLRQQEGATVTLVRDEIEDLRTGSVSLMPVGLEKLITVPEMTDLISFLKNWRYQSTTAAAVPSAPAGSP